MAVVLRVRFHNVTWFCPSFTLRHRPQCSVSLPQPQGHGLKPSKDVLRILNVSVVVPDFGVLVPPRCLTGLLGGINSPYNKLSKNTLANAGAGGKSFTAQCTPRSKLQDTQGFEFASSFWEDKRGHDHVDDAYRQNRMSTSSAVRHLYSLHIQTPVIGLVWVDGKVRAHVDWCKAGESRQVVSTSYCSHPHRLCSTSIAQSICSAPYLGRATAVGKRVYGAFHEWDLTKASDILEVFILLCNIDEWTIGQFYERVKEGIHSLTRS